MHVNLGLHVDVGLNVQQALAKNVSTKIADTSWSRLPSYKV